MPFPEGPTVSTVFSFLKVPVSVCCHFPPAQVTLGIACVLGLCEGCVSSCLSGNVLFLHCF